MLIVSSIGLFKYKSCCIIEFFYGIPINIFGEFLYLFCIIQPMVIGTFCKYNSSFFKINISIIIVKMARLRKNYNGFTVRNIPGRNRRFFAHL